MARSAEDHLEILELIARYNRAVDARHAEDYAGVFTEDGKFVMNGDIVGEGRAGLMAHVERTKHRRTLHMTSNAVIEVDGSEARLRVSVVAYDFDHGLVPYVFGEYDDRLVKVDGRWKFKLRNIVITAGQSASGAKPAQS